MSCEIEWEYKQSMHCFVEILYCWKIALLWKATWVAMVLMKYLHLMETDRVKLLKNLRKMRWGIIKSQTKFLVLN